MATKKLALTPLEIEDLILAGNLIANDSCPPSLMNSEVRIIHSIMGAFPEEDWNHDKVSFKEWKRRKNPHLLTIAFAITMPKGMP
jgi:predicted DNA-binding transcriptional regulator YafY